MLRLLAACAIAVVGLSADAVAQRRAVRTSRVTHGAESPLGRPAVRPSKVARSTHAEPQEEANVRIAGRTAIARRQPSVPARMLVERGLIRGTVLHHGRGRDVAGSELMRSVARTVTDFDPNHAPNPRALARRYDVVVSSFVLNVLPPRERSIAIREIRQATAGVAYITVRAVGDRAIRGTPEADGVRTSIGTFQRGYTARELVAELSQHFRRVDVIAGGDRQNSITVAATP